MRLSAQRPARRLGKCCLNCGPASAPLASISNNIVTNVVRDVALTIALGCLALYALTEHQFNMLIILTYSSCFVLNFHPCLQNKFQNM